MLVWSHYQFPCYVMLNWLLFFVRLLFKVCGNLVSSLRSLQVAKLQWTRNSRWRNRMPRTKMLLDLETCQSVWLDLVIPRHQLERCCNLLNLSSGILLFRHCRRLVWMINTGITVNNVRQKIFSCTYKFQRNGTDILPKKKGADRRLLGDQRDMRATLVET